MTQMQGGKAFRTAPLLFCALVWLSKASAAHGRFFAISISLIGDEPFLYRQDVKLSITVTNPHKKKLLYMQAGRLVSDIRVEFIQAPDGLEWSGETGGGPFEGDDWVESLVRVLKPGESIRAVYFFSSEYVNLPPGQYKTIARLRQFCDEFGIATGETVSNTVEFSVVPWETEATRTGRVHEVPYGEILVGLVKTADGDVLAAWRHTRQATDAWDRIVPVARDLPLEQALWAADGHTCVIAIPDSLGEKTEVIVAHKYNSNVERFLLKGRPTYPGLNAPGSPWGPPEPVKPQEPEQEGARDELTARCSGWACLVLGLACGLVLGTSVVWFLMRRQLREC